MAIINPDTGIIIKPELPDDVGGTSNNTTGYMISPKAVESFNCQGCEDFTDYLTKLGYVVSDSSSIDIGNILADGHLVSDAKDVIKQRFAPFRKQDKDIITGIASKQYAKQEVCGSATGSVTLPYRSSENLVIALDGTTPRFLTVRDSSGNPLLLGPGNYTLKRIATGVEIRNSSNADLLCTIRTNLGNPPLKLLVDIQGAGGGGGGSAITSYVGTYAFGSGGGGGARIVALIDLAKYSHWHISVGTGGTGGNFGYTYGIKPTNGTDGGSTKIYAHENEANYIEAFGGKGGIWSHGQSVLGGKGGTYDYSRDIEIIHVLGKAAGGNGNDNDKHASNEVSFDTIEYADEDYFYYGKLAGVDCVSDTSMDAGGGPSPSANATSTSELGQGGHGGRGPNAANLNHGYRGKHGYVKFYY